MTSAVISAFVNCVSPIRLHVVPVSGMNAFVELFFSFGCFCGLCSFVVIEFAFCLYCCGFSVWDYCSSTFLSWVSASSLDSVVIILSSSSSYHPSCDFSIWDYHSLTLPVWPSVFSPDSDVSFWDYCSFTLPLWPSASSLDSVIIISWSSLDSDVIISFDLLNLYLAVESSVLFVVLLVM